jgi:hypothetical protein
MVELLQLVEVDVSHLGEPAPSTCILQDVGSCMQACRFKLGMCVAVGHVVGVSQKHAQTLRHDEQVPACQVVVHLHECSCMLPPAMAARLATSILEVDASNMRSAYLDASHFTFEVSPYTRRGCCRM